MENKIEKERKWLLKRLPRDITPDEEISIIQYYKDGKRYRREVMRGGGVHGRTIYTRIIKTKAALGVNYETNIEEIGFTEFNEHRHNDTNKEISKTRYVYEFKQGKIEIDEFDNLTLIIMEVENVDMEDIINFPLAIEREILMEVTGDTKFDNFNLAE